jgi:hypothetical protein
LFKDINYDATMQYNIQLRQKYHYSNMWSSSLTTILALLVTQINYVAALISIHRPIRTISSSLALPMAPRFQDGQWVPTSDEEGPSAGYDTVGTLLRHGPKPFFHRIFQADEYEQAVLKFMAGENCDRNTAQGNMDAYLRNPQDWMFNRMEEQKRGTKFDYVTLEPSKIVLTSIWSVIVIGTAGRALYCLQTGDSFVCEKKKIFVHLHHN